MGTSMYKHNQQTQGRKTDAALLVAFGPIFIGAMPVAVIRVALGPIRQRKSHTCSGEHEHVCYTIS